MKVLRNTLLRRFQGRAGLGACFGCLPCFPDDAVNGLRRLSAVTKPFVDFFQVDGVVYPFVHRVVGADLIDRASVATAAAVNSDNFVIRTVFRAFASQSECYHKKVVIGRRNVGEVVSFAKTKIVESEGGGLKGGD